MGKYGSWCRIKATNPPLSFVTKTACFSLSWHHLSLKKDFFLYSHISYTLQQFQCFKLTRMVTSYQLIDIYDIFQYSFSIVLYLDTLSMLCFCCNSTLCLFVINRKLCEKTLMLTFIHRISNLHCHSSTSAIYKPSHRKINKQ